MKLYAVLGKTGLWDYQDTWVVKCFSDKSTAVEYCEKLDAIILDYQNNKRFNRDMEYSQSLQDALRPYDPEAYLDNGIISYSVQGCDYTP